MVDTGRIQRIEPEIKDTNGMEIYAKVNLVSPGLVDSHNHLDMACTADGARYPNYNANRSTRNGGSD